MRRSPSPLHERPFHPALFGALPTLLVLAQNGLEIAPIDALRPLVLSLAAALALQVALGLAMRDGRRAALLTTLTVGLFSAYGRLYTGNVHGLLRGPILAAGMPGRHQVVVPVILLLWLLAAWAVFRLARFDRHITTLLNVAGLSLLAGALITIGSNEWQIGRPWPQPGSAALDADRIVAEWPASPEERSDIYYLILDGYARDDVLADTYAHDNSAFLDSLRKHGFTVLEDAHSNYNQTSLSLAATFNMDYLGELIPPEMAESSDRTPLARMIRHSTLQRVLEGPGYEFVTLPGGYRPGEMRADRTLRTAGAESTLLERLLIENSGLALVDLFPQLPPSLTHPAYPRHRRRVREQFSHLASVPPGPAPQFVYAHILVPHPPFVFDARGAPSQPDYPYVLLDGSAFPGERASYRRRYREQLVFVNRELDLVLTQFLRVHGDTAWIVLQGDHGPGSGLDWDSMEGTDLRERFGILLAYRAPGGSGGDLARFNSPVNLFRALLPSIGGPRLSLQPDRAYFSTWNRPYAFERVPQAAIERTAPTEGGD